MSCDVSPSFLQLWKFPLEIQNLLVQGHSVLNDFLFFPVVAHYLFSFSDTFNMVPIVLLTLPIVGMADSIRV